MGRILFFVLLAVAVVLVWRWVQRRSLSDPARGADPRIPQEMVSCAKCGLHVPRQEALLLGDRYFCCEEHRGPPPAA